MSDEPESTDDYGLVVDRFDGRERSLEQEALLRSQGLIGSC